MDCILHLLTKKEVIMKRLIILLIALMPLVAFAQENSEQSLTKKEKKEQQKKDEDLAKARVNDMVLNQEWVLNVTELLDKNHNRHFLTTTNNFLVVNEGTGIMQLNFSGIPGLNDYGLKGKVENYEVKNSGDKMYARGTINTPKGAFTFVLFPSIYNARLELSGSFNDTINLFGRLISPDDAILQDRINVY